MSGEQTKLEPPKPKVVPCKGCGRPVIWAYNEDGELKPYDAEPDPNLEKGHRLSIRVRNGTVIAREGVPIVDAKKMAATPMFPTRLRSSHFVTCPHADKFYNSKKRKK